MPLGKKYLSLKTSEGFLQHPLWSIDNAACFEISIFHFQVGIKFPFLNYRVPEQTVEALSKSHKI